MTAETIKVAETASRPPRDRIILKDLGFYGYHGLMQEENSLGQRFRVDLECGLDLAPAGRSDHMGDSLSYALIYHAVEEAFQGRRFKLIEAVAQHIADTLFERFARIEWVMVRVRKPEAPIAMVVGEAAVEIHRTRP